MEGGWQKLYLCISNASVELYDLCIVWGYRFAGRQARGVARLYLSVAVGKDFFGHLLSHPQRDFNIQTAKGSAGPIIDKPTPEGKRFHVLMYSAYDQDDRMYVDAGGKRTVPASNQIREYNGYFSTFLRQS